MEEGVVMVLYLKIILTSKQMRLKLRTWTRVHILDMCQWKVHGSE